MSTRPVFTLYEFNSALREAISGAFPSTYLITAEIASINEHTNGHCYLELVEKDATGVKAQARATIWSYVYKTLSREFQSITGKRLAKGLKILLETSVSFHERYGLSLNVQKIDPTYTLGEMARKRREIIDRLTKENLVNRNRERQMPLVPQRVAVISSPKAAGYEDFVKHLRGNPFGYAFSIQLVPALMQGDGAEESILKALAFLAKQPDGIIDVVVIARGGGGAVDLDCFDSYDIGRAIAMMPLPVISGIGHERDRSVVDEVAHTSVKTPTAAAALLMERLKSFEDTLDRLSKALFISTKATLDENSQTLHGHSKRLAVATSTVILKNRYTLANHSKVVLGVSRHVERRGIHLKTLSDRVLAIAWSARRDARLQESHVSALTTALCTGVSKYFPRSEERLKSMAGTIDRIARKDITTQKRNLDTMLSTILFKGRRLIVKYGEKLNSIEKAITHLTPDNVLKRGYSITYCNGKALKDEDDVKLGDHVKTVLYKGAIESTVIIKSGLGSQNEEIREVSNERN
ncbi:MAG: exodeoxyribonuclease VII large subunit [Nitrospirae bacterium]|nr:exodeoxyribonuclease VII large subunit [Nitrospirota bacterium]